MDKRKLIYFENLGYQDSTLAMLNEHFDVTTLATPDNLTDDVLSEVVVLLTHRGYPVGDKLLNQASNLKIVASSTLVAPHIDQAACEKRGVTVCHLGNEHAMINTISSTAELTWGLVIAATRQIPTAHREACKARWNLREFGYRSPKMLSEMTLGVVGLGRLGKMVAQYGDAFCKNVIYWSPTTRDGRFIRCQSLNELAERADIVSLHLLHLSQTEKIISREFFQHMRSGSYLVNTARGEILDEGALLEALESGRLAGAGLDVLSGEYKPDFKEVLSEHPLIQYARSNDNLIITPHYAGATRDAWELTEHKLVELIRNTTT